MCTGGGGGGGGGKDNILTINVPKIIEFLDGMWCYV